MLSKNGGGFLICRYSCVGSWGATSPSNIIIHLQDRFICDFWQLFPAGVRIMPAVGWVTVLASIWPALDWFLVSALLLFIITCSYFIFGFGAGNIFFDKYVYTNYLLHFNLNSSVHFILGPYAPTGGLDKPQRYRWGKFEKRHTPYAPRGGKCRMGVNLAKCGVKFTPTREQG